MSLPIVQSYAFQSRNNLKSFENHSLLNQISCPGAILDLAQEAQLFDKNQQTTFIGSVNDHRSSDIQEPQSQGLQVQNQNFMQHLHSQNQHLNFVRPYVNQNTIPATIQPNYQTILKESTDSTPFQELYSNYIVFAKLDLTRNSLDRRQFISLQTVVAESLLKKYSLNNISRTYQRKIITKKTREQVEFSKVLRRKCIQRIYKIGRRIKSHQQAVIWATKLYQSLPSCHNYVQFQSRFVSLLKEL